MGNREETKRVAGAEEVSPDEHTPDTWARERSDLSGRATQDERRPTYGNHEALAGKARPAEADPEAGDETAAPADRPDPPTSAERDGYEPPARAVKARTRARWSRGARKNPLAQ